MPKRRRPRVQRVALRQRRREWIRHRFGAVMRRGVMAGVVVGISLGLLSQGDAFLAQRLSGWMPQVHIEAPSALTGLPFESDFPSNRLWLWMPWSTARLESAWKNKFPAVRHVTCDKSWTARTIFIHVEPRKALLRLGENTAMDAEGVVFPYLAAPSAAPLPTLELASPAARTSAARWVQELSRQQSLWPKITLIKQDKLGFFRLMLQSGTSVIWGLPVQEETGPKARAVLRALADAQDHFKGAALADLRFFSEGRIIVTPKH